MSNHLAVATVTASLGQFLQGAVGRDVPGATVTTLRPDGKPPRPSAGVNVYLYLVTPNAAFRNSDLPNRDRDGRVVTRPRVALDLHYLLTFYGDEGRLEPQRVLGSAVRALHARPVLTDRMVQDTVENTRFPYLASSNVAAEVESVKFSPLALTLEELSKLWSVFFQIPYTLSVAYNGTVVFLETEDAPRRPLPVRRPGVYVVPFGQPVIERVSPPGGPSAPVGVGTRLVLEGRALAGDITRVRVGGVEVVPDEATETGVAFTLPATVRAGVQGVRVVHLREMGEPPSPRVAGESNVVAFVLSPAITGTGVANVTGTGAAPRTAEVTVELSPPAAPDQRVVLALNERRAGPAAPGSPPPASLTFTAPPRTADASSVTFAVAGLGPAAYLARVQVDGAESQLSVDTDPDSPGFDTFDGPLVTIP